MSRFLEDDAEGTDIELTNDSPAGRAEPLADHEQSADDYVDQYPDDELSDDQYYEEPSADDQYYDEIPEQVEPRQRRRPGSVIMNILAVLVSLGVLVGGGYFVVTKITDGVIGFTTVADYEGPGETEIIVDIPAGATLTDMGDLLVENDVVASTRAFLNAARDTPGSSSIQPGSYRLMTKMAAADAVAALMNLDNQISDRVTIVEGLRNSVVIEQLSTQTGIPAADFEAVLANPAALNLPEWSNGATEGFLFPETYAYDATPTAEEILSQMTDHFNKVNTELDFAAKAEAAGVDPYDAVTVASIIEKETRDPVYGPDIAQVLYNRLEQGMKLQLDSTVIYAVNSPGTVTTSDEERANKSPYNTYVHEGLPPGAISNPGKNSLSAAVNPTKGDYLYFVATNPLTGETKFAATWEEHEANVAEFQQWCRDNPDHCTGG